MKFVEKVAKTIDNAITDALIELGATTDEVDIEILEKGSKGLFGIGAKRARVRVTIKDPVVTEEINTIEELIEEVSETQETQKIDEVKREFISEEGLEKQANEDPVEKAQKFLANILKAMNIEGKIEAKMMGDKLLIDISGEKMGVIIGKRGETLDSLQYLTNIVVNKDYEGYIKVMIDTENYRSRREETLRKLAYKLAKKASQTKKPVTLEPMNPYDRRIIHSALQDSKTVKTHSEGKEPFRRVVISPSSINRFNNK